MSPKHSSLAFEEKEQIFQVIDEEYAPELNLLVKGRIRSESDVFEDPIRISGHITISF